MGRIWREHGVSAIMSLISDALKKAQRERSHPSPGASAESRPPSPRPRGDGARSPTRVFVVANVAVLIAALLGGIAFFRGPSKTPDQHARPPVGHEMRVAPPSSSTSAAESETQVSIPQPSVKKQPVSSAPESPPYDLAGMTVVGPNTLLSISRRSDRRSVWVPLGKTVGEVTAVSYDPLTDRAVIEVEGRTLNIRMRDGSADEPKIRAAE